MVAGMSARVCEGGEDGTWWGWGSDVQGLIERAEGRGGRALNSCKRRNLFSAFQRKRFLNCSTKMARFIIIIIIIIHAFHKFCIFLLLLLHLPLSLFYKSSSSPAFRKDWDYTENKCASVSKDEAHILAADTYGLLVFFFRHVSF